ncbi:MAG TPA: N-6 DNA methylase, partial [Chloroflexota bacterium]|nr:N-6 DNA methylase [Chloroflexota bacterium]
MDVEELGSVYESLLDYHPIVRWVSERPRFEFVQGSERKTTGSYYTPSELVLELIKSALDPVIAQALAGGRTRDQKRARLLRLTVCDPAAGSGHFLLAAARRIGRALAQLDSGDGEPDPAAIRIGTREAIRHCIYGVDLNPLAVDLCKLALWIEGQTPGKPLSFLDHRIKNGNSLVGATPAVLEAGIPDEAFAAVTGDDKTLVKALIKRNREELKRTRAQDGQQLRLGTGLLSITADEDEVLEAMEITDLPDDSTVDTGAKRTRYTTLEATLRQKKLVANVWSSAFFWTVREGEPMPPTQMDLFGLRRGSATLSARQLDGVDALERAVRFSHWHLEFPNVFGDDGQGGFNCVLGNPPWER